MAKASGRPPPYRPQFIDAPALSDRENRIRMVLEASAGTEG